MSVSSLSPEVQRLVEPIAGEHPTGVSLRYDAVYQAIAEARREDDPTLPQGDWEHALKRADWPAVERLCIEVLSRRSKDLQVAAWLAEAWLHRHGLRGLSDGLSLVEQLGSKYWDTVHPQIEDGDVDYRTAPYAWINENLSLTTRLTVPLAVDQSADGRKLTLADWEEALRVENLSRKDSEVAAAAEKARKITRNAFLTSVSLTPSTAFTQLLTDLSACTDVILALEKHLDEKLGEDSPGLGRLRGTMESMRKAVREFGGEPAPKKSTRDERKPLAGAPVAAKRAEAARKQEPTSMSDHSTEDDLAPAAASGPIRSREEAYRRLSEAADYLLRTEPHSPSPYLVMRAVTWGRMPLTDLLQELVQSEGDLVQLYTLLGMRSGMGQRPDVEPEEFQPGQEE